MKDVIKVARKELLEMFRDKRVRTSALFMPILLVIMIIQIFGVVMNAANGAKKQTIYVVNQALPFLPTFDQQQIKIERIDSLATGEELIRKGKAKVVVDAPAPPDEAGQQVLNAYFDPKEETSQMGVKVIEGLIAEQNKVRASAALAAQGIPVSATEPYKVEEKEVAVGGQGAGGFVVAILPYMIVLFAFTGGMSLASDLVAGEKEKNTLETLLITPVRRTHIVLGKFLALSVVCLLGSVSCLVGLFLASKLHLPGSQEMFKQGFGITAPAALLVIALMLPLVAFFASILLAISSFAKNPREAQTYLALVNLLVVAPAVFSQVIGFTDYGKQLWINAVPVLNTANNVRNALQGKVDPIAIAITVGVGVVLAAIGLWVAIWLFNREQVLVRV